jgi:hypothetical protein
VVGGVCGGKGGLGWVWFLYEVVVGCLGRFSCESGEVDSLNMGIVTEASPKVGV